MLSPLQPEWKGVSYFFFFLAREGKATINQPINRAIEMAGFWSGEGGGGSMELSSSSSSVAFVAWKKEALVEALKSVAVLSSRRVGYR